MLSPIDLLPEFLPEFLPVIGPLDDVAAVVLLRYAARSVARPSSSAPGLPAPTSSTVSSTAAEDDEGHARDRPRAAHPCPGGGGRLLPQWCGRPDPSHGGGRR
ncbi:hypothetical protein [Pseudokineococcus basanitobsidens]|uniref:hypothetical protein n=1 Tax=Pseudokineococcus basanitobsidens TaxID=1926649 RepID=UPI003BB592C7